MGALSSSSGEIDCLPVNVTALQLGPERAITRVATGLQDRWPDSEKIFACGDPTANFGRMQSVAKRVACRASLNHLIRLSRIGRELLSESGLDDIDQDQMLIGWAVDIVSSYVSNNSLPATELPNLLQAVHASLSKVVEPADEEVKQQPPTPPVSIRKSIAEDHLVCLEDGKHFKSLKRHLHTVHGLSPEQYRERWGLSRDYPMVAPDYAKARSALAKGMGLGASRRAAQHQDDDAAMEPGDEAPPTVPAVEEPEAEEAPAAAKATRGRKKKV